LAPLLRKLPISICSAPSLIFPLPKGGSIWPSSWIDLPAWSLGWKLSDSLQSDIVTAALDKTLARGPVAPGALFHSDRGCQYTSGQLRKRLARANLLQSMSAKGCCYDNAMAESFFASFKNEALPENGRFESHRTASRAVFDYIECFYNRRRRHTSLGGLSPLTFLNRFFQNQQPSLN
jgi:transposase InsO family protein